MVIKIGVLELQGGYALHHNLLKKIGLNSISIKSGDDLTASEMKVCLEVCKTYSSEDIVKKANNILDEVPFDVDE